MAIEGRLEECRGNSGNSVATQSEAAIISGDPDRSPHVPYLDGVRGLAILLVILNHAQVFAYGWIGVDIFFVLSGYLITGILVRAKNRPHYYRNFIARRTLRILPPYYAYLLVALVALPSIGYQAKTADQIWAWTYLTNFAIAFRGGWGAVAGNTQHLWSVAIEEQFYILWPAIVAACSVVQLRRVCGWGIIIALALRAANTSLVGGNYLASYVLVPTRMDALLVGAALSLAPAGAALRQRSLATWVGVVSGIFAVLVLLWRSAHDPLIETIGYSSIAIFAGSLLVLCTTTPLVARLFALRPLRLAGRYSYAAYLGHVIVLNVLASRFGLRGWPLALLGIAVTFALSAVSWYCFEAPILSLKVLFPLEDRTVITGGSRSPERADPIARINAA